MRDPDGAGKSPSEDASVGGMADSEERLPRAGDDLQRDDFGERPRTRRRLEEFERPFSSVRPRDPEGDEDLQRPHAFQKNAGEDDQTYFIRVMLVAGFPTIKYFGSEVSGAEKQVPYARQGPELQQWMLHEIQRRQRWVR